MRIILIRIGGVPQGGRLRSVHNPVHNPVDKFAAGQAGLEARVVDNLWISVTVPLAGWWAQPATTGGGSVD